MFCFQCEQTATNGCKTVGVCGKDDLLANKQDELLATAIMLAKEYCDAPNPEVSALLQDALFVTVTNVSFDKQHVEDWINLLKRYSHNMDNTFSMTEIWQASEDERSLKSLLIFGLKGLAAYAHHARVLGMSDQEVDHFFYEALAILPESLSLDQLLGLNLKCGEVNLRCMQLLDQGHYEHFGHPFPASVSMRVEAGPFIVISGHDMQDLYLLLQQTEGKGIAIYTHGEMLPAHGYPKLRAFKHLKGHFGTAWQNQQSEFSHLPAPILFTTNCIMPVKKSYEDRVFTTSLVAYPNMVHIDGKKDFTALIDKALALGGFDDPQLFTGINGGSELTTGFGHHAVNQSMDAVVDAIKAGDLKHIFLVGGCDGAKTGRNYYTQLVQALPKDVLTLTLACGKFRFNDIDFGKIGDLPRLLDVGQCNDAYGAINIALSLSNRLHCSVDELPLTFVLSWYEQKAVVVLLTLLHLNIKNIYLGPTLPLFLSPNVLDVLVQKWQIKAISTVEADLKQMYPQEII
ncbi:hydroxylamine reductase [Entomospira culicis]|uniref:Hydroxylamine reductase n=1 Tax=Entomospira culicis TaxID=2719989 RepID=A0A968KU49_9SPIO|nr:hydroxylamine reductase [Entomospira culicis]NIZ18939.1 hydroxylamine reductase [Entomospira culicis]NIZ69154.1 hydroxylamine reductase [Entomospira culicis]WDI37741.1 hydroxylamine reductase [Entomospira culicis]WDI39369.1 hydroxylamine reductase [Entomospira culicis]